MIYLPSLQSVLIGCLLVNGLGAPLRPALPSPSALASTKHFYPAFTGPYAAMRFLSQGQLYRPTGHFAAYSERQYYKQAGEPNRQEIQLRFGSVYLLQGETPEEGTYHYLGSILSVRGRDTMQVFVQPNADYPYWLYDSIPFRPGRYELKYQQPISLRTFPASGPYSPRQLDSLGIPPVGFATYYWQHQAELARYNPFTDPLLKLGPQEAYYRLPKGYVTPRDYVPTEGYAPQQAHDLFHLLLVHSTYLRLRKYQLRPLRRHEQPTKL